MYHKNSQNVTSGRIEMNKEGSMRFERNPRLKELDWYFEKKGFHKHGKIGNWSKILKGNRKTGKVDKRLHVRVPEWCMSEKSRRNKIYNKFCCKIEWHIDNH